MLAGEKLEQALELYPQWVDKLTQPLEAVQVLLVYRTALAPGEAVQVQARTQFLAEAKRIHARPTARQRVRTWSLRLAPILVVLLLLLGGAWLVFTAGDVLPGATLYPLKIASEQARLLLAQDPAAGLEMQRSFDALRIQEVAALLELGRRRSVTFAGGLEQVLADRWLIGGLSVRIPDDAQIVGQVQRGIYVQVDGETRPGGVLQAVRIQPREYEIRGELVRLKPEQILVGGVPVQVNGDTVWQADLPTGTRVRAVALQTLGGEWVGRYIEPLLD
jgi:hypothetical protein